MSERKMSEAEESQSKILTTEEEKQRAKKLDKVIEKLKTDLDKETRAFMEEEAQKKAEAEAERQAKLEKRRALYPALLEKEKEVEQTQELKKKQVRKEPTQPKPKHKKEEESESVIFYSKIPKGLLDDKNISQFSAKIQWAVYYDYCPIKDLSKNPSCTVGPTRLSQRMNLSIRRVKENDKILKREGWLKKKSNGPGKTATTILIAEKFYPVQIYYDDDREGGKIVRLKIIDQEQFNLRVRFEEEKELKEEKKEEKKEK